MQRRTFLVGASGLLSAGCLSLGPRPRIGRLVVANFTTSPISVTVTVLERDSVVYDEVHHIEANDPNSIVVPSASVTDELPDGPGRYVIEYGLAGDESKSFDFSEAVDSDWGQVHIDVREEKRVELLFSSGCDTAE